MARNHTQLALLRMVILYIKTYYLFILFYANEKTTVRKEGTFS